MADWIALEPANARLYCHLAQFYRMQGRQEAGLALLLEAVTALRHRAAEAIPHMNWGR